MKIGFNSLYTQHLCKNCSKKAYEFDSRLQKLVKRLSLINKQFSERCEGISIFSVRLRLFCIIS